MTDIKRYTESGPLSQSVATALTSQLSTLSTAEPVRAVGAPSLIRSRTVLANGSGRKPALANRLIRPRAIFLLHASTSWESARSRRSSVRTWTTLPIN
jgi:hypothetical protein